MLTWKVWNVNACRYAALGGYITFVMLFAVIIMMQVGVESSYVIDAALREGILKFSEDLEEVKSMVWCFHVERCVCVRSCLECALLLEGHYHHNFHSSVALVESDVGVFTWTGS